MATNPYTVFAQEDAQREPSRPTGGAPTPAPTPGVYEQLAREDIEEMRGRLDQAFDIGTQFNPDEEAQARRLSARTGLPIETVRRNMQQAQRAERMRELRQTTAMSPVLRRQMSDPRFAALAHDDAANLAGTEKTLHDWGDFFRGIPGALGAGLARTSAGVSTLYGELFQDTLAARSIRNTVLPFVDLYSDAETVRGYASDAADWSHELAEDLRPDTYTTARWVRSALSGAESIPTSLIGAGISAVGTPAAGITWIGATTTGESIYRGRQSGLEGAELYAYAGLQGLLEAGTEAIPLGFLTDALRLTGANRSFLRNMAGGMISEQIGEQAATLTQDFVDWAMLPENASKTFDDYLDERPGAALDTAIATLVGTGGNYAVAGVANKAGEYWLRRRAGDVLGAQVSEGNAMFMERAFQAAEASALLERSPETFRQFIGQATQDTQLEEVYFDREALADVLNQDGIDPDTANMLNGVFAVNLQKAAREGTDVRVSMADLLAGVSGSGIEQQLVDIAKLDPLGMSRAEARDFMQNGGEQLQAEMQQIIERVALDAEAQTRVDAIRDEITTELNRVNRFTAETNENYATLVSTVFATMAERTGVPIDQLWDRFRLRTQATPVAGPSLEQDITATPAFREWFGESKVVDDQGKPLVVYHGTTEKFDAFDPAKRGANYPDDTGFFFTTDEDDALGWAAGQPGDGPSGNPDERAIPVFVSLQNPLEIPAGDLEPEFVWFGERDALRAEIEAGGHDGVIVYRDNGDKMVIALRPEQIKSVDNRGTFDPADPNMYNQGPTERRSPSETGEKTGITLVNNLANTAEFARENRFKTGRDLKLALQERALAAQEADGIDLTTLDDANIDRLADYVVEDALEALQDNLNAIGWYDRAVTEAKQTLGELYPEILTDGESEFAFIWALAVTSNGLKVNDNFALAAKAYDEWKETGRFPTKIGTGTAAGAINAGLARYHQLVDKLGSWEAVRDLMVSENTVKEIEAATGLPISGELKGEMVRGAAILGPKIGNGFFSNLYGHFDALTMDRWLMRTQGRWRGTLVQLKPDMEMKKRTQIRELFSSLSRKEMNFLQGFFNGSDIQLRKRMTNAEIDALAQEVAKRSIVPRWREAINEAAGGEFLRKFGNSLAGYLDGQVEQPTARERIFLRKVFRAGLERLQQMDGLQTLTMADLQALLWYPEKLVYDTAKKQEGQEVRSYEDEEAPDYANAARKLVADRLGRDGSEQRADGPGLRTLEDGSQEDQLNQSNRGAYSPATNTITLFRNADLSTFLHESGHFFLEMLDSLAQDQAAPQQIKDDWARTLKWFGVTQEQWSGFDLEGKRQYHEKWAKSFEAYLFTGKAPSIATQSLFTRFRGWLISVYRKLTAIGERPSPAIREVFDRMIATDAQIEEMQAARSMIPLFENQEESGLDPDAWRALQDLAQDAKDEAVRELEAKSMRDMRWLNKARSQELSRLRAQAADLRKRVRSEVAAEVSREPVYRAIDYLKRGRIDGVQAEGPHRISMDVLEEMYTGEELERVKAALGTGGYGMMGRENALHPDTVANIFGYTSGDHMIREILAAEPMAERIEGLAEQRLLENHGEVVDEAAMEEAANRAVHNEARARFVAAEYNALAKAANRPKIVKEAARAFAKETISRLRVRDLKPSIYEAAAARAAKAAVQQSKAGNTLAAAAEKRNELINLYAAMEARNTREQLDKDVARLRRLDARPPKTIDPEYIEQIHALLEAVDLRKGTTLKQIDRGESLAKWIEKQRENGFEPLIDENMAAALARAKSYKNMTVEELRGLVDAIKNIEHLGRLKNRLLTAKRQREFAAARDEAVATIKANATRTVDIPIEEERTAWERIKAGGREFLAMHRKFASLLRQMDGFVDGGSLWELLVRPANEAGDTEAVMRADATVELSRILAPALGKDMQQKVFIPAIGASLTKQGRLAVVLNMGNPINRQRLEGGDGWTPAQLDAIASTLTAEELGVVQAVWDYINSYWPKIAAKEKRVTGVAPEKVDATPFTVTSSDGVVVEMAGGYYPIKYDARRSSRAGALTAAEIANQMTRGLFSRATTRRGHTKARVDEVNRPLRKDLGVVVQHLTEVIHDLAWHEYLIDANRMLGDKQIENAVRQHYGPEALKALKDAVTDMAAGEVPAANWWERSINHLRTGVTVGGMGWSLSTALLQPLGLSQSIYRIGLKHVLRGMSRIATDAQGLERGVKWIYEQSDFMRLRAQTMQREISEIQNQVENRNHPVRDSFFWMIQKLQLIADVPTWVGQYEKMIAAGETHERAVELADQAVIDSQGGGQIKDLAAIQRGGPMQKLWTNFYSYFSTTYNLSAEAVGQYKMTGNKGKLASDAFVLLVLPAILSYLVRNAIKGDIPDDPEELAKDLANEQLGYIFGMMVGARDLYSAATWGNEAPAGMAVFGQVSDFATQVGQGEVDAAALRAGNRLAGTVFHYPAAQVQRTVEGMEAVIDGRTKNPAAPLLGPSREARGN